MIFSFNQAREACQAKGGQWDLVVFESDEELEYVKKLINCLPEAFWVGYRENNGVSIDILNKVKFHSEILNISLPIAYLGGPNRAIGIYVMYFSSKHVIRSTYAPLRCRNKIVTFKFKY